MIHRLINISIFICPIVAVGPMCADEFGMFDVASNGTDLINSIMIVMLCETWFIAGFFVFIYSLLGKLLNQVSIWFHASS